MSAMERTRYRRSLGSNALAFNEPRRDPRPASSTDVCSDDSIFDLQDQPDPREFAPFAASQRTSILTRVVAGGMVVSAFAILVAVFNSDVTRVLIDKARVSIGGATRGAVLGVLNNRSITPDPVMARDWYRKAASLGLAEAQQRLTQLQN